MNGPVFTNKEYERAFLEIPMDHGIRAAEIGVNRSMLSYWVREGYVEVEGRRKEGKRYRRLCGVGTKQMISWGSEWEPTQIRRQAQPSDLEHLQKLVFSLTLKNLCGV